MKSGLRLYNCVFIELFRIKSPFSALLGLVEVLKNQYDEFDSTQHKKFIGYISESTQKIFNLADNLLIWSKLQLDKFDPDLKPIYLKQNVQACEEIYSEMLKNKEVTFYNTISSSTMVLSDEFMLSTIFRNLISNAIKYTKPGGSITVFINEKVENAADEITIGISDTGVGIPKKRIGELFGSIINTSTEGTNREKGSGLGLILCKEFILLLGNNIWVESEVGEGSTFYFNLKAL